MQGLDISLVLFGAAYVQHETSFVRGKNGMLVMVSKLEYGKTIGLRVTERYTTTTKPKIMI